MASLNDNPYKRMKKALKGSKMDGMMAHKMAQKSVKMTGKFQGKSNKLGQGGRAAQLKAQGVPGGVIGNLARAAQAAPGQKNFHKKKVATPKNINLGMAMKKKGSKKYPTTNSGKEGDIENKRSVKGTVSMKGNVKRKGGPSMGQQPGAQGLKEMKAAKKKLACA